MSSNPLEMSFFSGTISTGKHMICDLVNIKHMSRLESMELMRELLNEICARHDFTVLGSIEHKFEPQGLSLVYMLSESHISIHTFPEQRYLALDIYTCRHYSDDSVYMQIYAHLVDWFQCDLGEPTILARGIRPTIERTGSLTSLDGYQTKFPTVSSQSSFTELCNGV